MATKMFALFALLALCASTITATYIPGYFPPTMALGAMNPCMQYCAMQQPFTTGSFTSPVLMMLQQPFTTGSFTSPALMMLQQPFASPFQRYLTPMTVQSMTTQAQCNCGAVSQITHQQQLLFAFNPMAVAMLPFFFQQPFVGVPF
ncbi:hypothetical protein GQ55_4G256500 [Panicum hallii var. hallii]|uniref:Bifunctional inhibitor/plant lipid transfer protein/seed storage helical domain-containing protein n=1 Tax=Panicum hallii var. hallii TaxID=1504633 RepID=A0A2T7E044_9POAL|nr:hypothetical protein GQ55_4G256500 [Panicum hallii var. hallii]